MTGTSAAASRGDGRGTAAGESARTDRIERHELVRAAVAAAPGVAVGEQRLKSGVYRLGCETPRGERSFVAKRLDPEIGRRNELVARRWLPAVGLAHLGPPLLAVAAEPDGSSVWHLFEDLGEGGLDAHAPDLEDLRLAVAAVAQVHMRFAGHALLAECRMWGGDLGGPFFSGSVQDAIRALEALRARRRGPGAQRLALCARLHSRLAGLRDEASERTATLSRAGGQTTLLHGDLWPMNVMIASSDGRRLARLIDWDHAGVGPVAYDMSTFLARLSPGCREPALQMYAGEVATAGWRLPSVPELNQAFETAELGRIANRVIWPALAAWEHDADWAYDGLAEVERWFEALTPVLPREGAWSQS